jgi:hypothetical protein
VVLLQQAQPRQLLLSQLELGGGRSARLLALGALGASSPEIRLQPRDLGGFNCEAAGKKRQPTKTKKKEDIESEEARSYP